MQPITILHLSDFQFGRKNRFGRNPNALDHNSDELGHHLERDLKHLADTNQLKVDLIIVTGDLAEEAKPNEFADAFLFLGRLCEYLQLDRRRAIVVPGNHDVSRHACDSYFESCASDGIFPRPPFHEKWKPFRDAFNRFYPSGLGVAFGIDGNPWTLYEVQELRLVVAGLNSTLAERHDIAPGDAFYKEFGTNSEYGHFGRCGDTQLEWFAKQLEDFRAKNWLRIGALHHNVGGRWTNAECGLRDRGKLLQHLGGGLLNVLFHGHTHETETTWEEGLPILSTGSAGLEDASLPHGLSNQYEIVQLLPAGLRSFARCYSPHQDRWVGDTSSSRHGDSWHREVAVGFPNTSETFPGATSGLTAFPLTSDEKESLRRYICPCPPSTGIVQTVAHCDMQKFPGDPPGMRLQAVLQEHGFKPRDVLRVDRNMEVRWSDVAQADAIFLLDSPLDNPYSGHVLKYYRDYLGGGIIGHAVETLGETQERIGIRRVQAIELGKDRCRSNKHELEAFRESGKKLKHVFGAFCDYLVLMRLPKAIVAGGPVGCDGGVVWLVYGITPKGTYAGADLLRPDNLRALERIYGRALPEYFEAVIEVPARLDGPCDNWGTGWVKRADIKRLQPLWVRRDLSIGDPVPTGLARFFGGNASVATAELPVSYVHLDLVAGCNYDCPGCIEVKARKKQLCLSFQAACDILLDIHRAGCRNLRFYGGEPTIHPHFGRILGLAAAMDLDMLLVTNGSMLGHTTVADALVAAQHKVHVRISLDAHSEDTHREQHGIAQVGYWNGLLGSIENLRSRGVAASVSYLVREDSLDELESACAFWHGRLDGGQRRALEFSARIPMDPGGKWLWSAPSKKEVRRTLRKLAGEYKEWFVVPGWLKEWSTDTSESAETPKDPVGPKDVDHCYSAYYRFGISPDHRVAKGDPEHAAGLPTVVAADGVTRLRVTNEAHISFCLFRRYEGPPFGCEYPSHDETFAQWARNKRISVLQQLKPQRDCQGNFCSRVTANRDVQGRVSRS